ncbi:MAG: hypothetical protein COT84_08735 [Chlamydiae bacterium CG10_big_fil_rev_8_21_14_0_10_35_9]|nr:MAG: hypothetical protein COT84_08735 [Chlamydiae bacterium CG10_big_fil_rev_8_21_14_0_10_35_9]
MLIIFDLDDTLVDTSGTLTPSQLKCSLEAMIEEGLLIKNFNDALLYLYKIDKHAGSAKETIKFFLKSYCDDISFFETGINKIYHDLPEDFNILPLPDAKNILETLRKQHHLAIVSSGKEKFQFLKLKKAGIEPSIFTKIVVTPNAEKKPHYKNLLEEFKINSNQSLVCGDKVLVDLLPAKELGIHTVHMLWGRGKNQTTGKQWADYTINELPEILKIIEEL